MYKRQVEDHDRLRDTLREILEDSGLGSVRAYSSCEEALRETAAPEAIVLDIGLPGMDGIEGARLFKERCPSCEIVMFMYSGKALRLGGPYGLIAIGGFAAIVRWTLFALINAEELGITQANVDEMKTSGNPEVKRVLGQEADSKLAADLGLDKEWVVNIVKAVGNYGESFERNVGQGSKLKLERGLNDLWSRGGLMYAPPIR